VTAIERLLWLASAWSVFFLFLLFDVPTLLERTADQLRQQHTPHWARHGHAPPPDDTTPQQHGRHAWRDNA